MAFVNVGVIYGAVIGVAIGGGIWLILQAVAKPRRSSVLHRVAHQVSDISDEAFQVVTRVDQDHHFLIQSCAQLLKKFGASDEKLQIELNRAQSPLTVSEFRARQAMWGLWGGVVVFGVTAILGIFSLLQPVSILILPFLAGLCAMFGYKIHLSRIAQRQISVLEQQIPVVWEFLSLSLAAGENLNDALIRISSVGQGIFIDELKSVVSKHAEGESLNKCLEELSKKYELSNLTRGIEQVLIALHRGTPLVGVLQALAQDSREDQKRQLLESAGKKEVLMLIPLVFVILPITVLFAVFPGLFAVQIGFS